MATGQQDAANARVAVAGAWYTAPSSATGPTSAESALPAEFVNVGYLSEDGTSRATDRSSENLRGWPGNALLRSVVTESTLTYTFTLVETTRTTIELATGAEIGDDGTYDVDPAATGGRRQFVFDIIDGDKIERRWLPDAEVTEVGETNFGGTDLIAYEITVTAYASQLIGGKAERVFNPSLAVATP